MSAFTQPLAQAREKLGWLVSLDWDDDTDVQRFATQALAALDRVEQQATDIEKELEPLLAAYEKHLQTGLYSPLGMAAQDFLEAVLSAREEGTDTR